MHLDSVHSTPIAALETHDAPPGGEPDVATADRLVRKHSGAVYVAVISMHHDGCVTVTSTMDRDYVVEEGIILVGGLLSASATLLLLRGIYLLVRRPLRRRTSR